MRPCSIIIRKKHRKAQYDPSVELSVPVEMNYMKTPEVDEMDIDRRVIYEKQRENDNLMKTAMFEGYVEARNMIAEQKKKEREVPRIKTASQPIRRAKSGIYILDKIIKENLRAKKSDRHLVFM